MSELSLPVIQEKLQVWGQAVVTEALAPYGIKFTYSNTLKEDYTLNGIGFMAEISIPNQYVGYPNPVVVPLRTIRILRLISFDVWHELLKRLPEPKPKNPENMLAEITSKLSESRSSEVMFSFENGISLPETTDQTDDEHAQETLMVKWLIPLLAPSVTTLIGSTETGALPAGLKPVRKVATVPDFNVTKNSVLVIRRSDNRAVASFPNREQAVYWCMVNRISPLPDGEWEDDYAIVPFVDERDTPPTLPDKHTPTRALGFDPRMRVNL